MDVAAFGQPRGQAAQRLSELRGRHLELVTETRRARRAVQEDSRQRTDLARALATAEANATAWGSAEAEAEAKSARDRLARMEKAHGRHAAEAERASAAAAVVEQAIDEHIRAHAGELEREIVEDVEVAHSRLLEALEALNAAVGMCVSVGLRHQALVRVTDEQRHRRERVPELPDALVRAAGLDPADLERPMLHPIGAVVTSAA